MTASSPVAFGAADVAADQTIDGAARQVTERLQQTQSRVLRIRWLTAAGSLAVLALGVIASLALVDHALELPWGLRGFAFAGLMALLAGSLWEIRRRFIAGVTLAKTAAETESQIAQFGQRLRTTLDYEQPPRAQAAASPRLLAALRQQTAHLAGQVDWDAAVDSRPALLALAAAVVALLGWGSALALFPEYRTATARVLLWPAEYTQVAYTPQEQTVRFGDAAELEVTITGRPLTTAVVRHRPAGSQDEWTTIDLARLNETPTAERDEAAPSQAADSVPLQLSGPFRPRLESLERDLELEVVAGPRALPLGRITVVQPLKLERASAQILPPPYTGRPPESAEGLDWRVLEGSQANVTFELNRPAAEAQLIALSDPAAKSGGDDDQAPLPAPIPLTISGSTLIGSLPDLRQPATYSLVARTADGMSLDASTLRIRVQADRPPEVRFIAPQEELVVTATTEVPVIAEALDDLGLHAVGIQYQINDGELRTLWTGSGEGATETLRAVASLLLEELNVTFRDSVSYYAYAEDNYFGQPRRTTTELRFIEIRPYKVDYQLTEGEGGGGACNGSSASLEELVQRQRKILVATFAAREDRTVSAETAATLRQQEDELRQMTREFAAALEAKLGPVPPLAKAAAGMDAAVDALADRELPGAVVGERQALAALMQARENLRQMLKNSNSQQASACRKVDREFRQRLRMPEKKAESAESRLAEARNQLQKLAERERQWGQQARQSCQSPGSSSGSKASSNPSPGQQSGQQQSQPERQNPKAPSNSAPPAAESPSSPTPSSKPGETSKPGEGSNPEGTPAAATPSAEELAQAQSKLRQDLAELKRQLAELKSAGSTAPRQADQADEAMQRGLEQLAQQQGDGAAQAAEESAEQLDQLADHLAAMGARDFGQRLDEAHRQAQELARAQAEVARDSGAPEGADSPSSATGRPAAETSSGQPTSGQSSSEKSSSGQSSSKPSSSAEGTAGPQGAAASPPAGSPGSAPQSPRGTRSGGGTEPSRQSAAELARAQRELATRVEMLAELLEALRRDASTESPALRRKLETAAAETPPGQIAAEMRQAASQLASGSSTQGAQAAAEARDDLRQLAQALGAARGAFSQPQLQELLALEEQLAQLLQQVQRDDEGRTAEAQRKWQDLATKLDRLAAGDHRLAEVLDKPPSAGADGSPSKSPGDSPAGSQSPAQSSGTNRPAPGANPRPGKQVPNGSRPVTPGHYEWITQRNIDGVRDVARVLQTRIQEAILAGALLDSDQPVPPEYKPLVEKYYKTLSDDLR